MKSVDVLLPIGTPLICYYEAIEQASAEMLAAAREGNWNEVAKLEGVCAVLIAQLKEAATKQSLPPEEQSPKARLMQRILLNDAEIRDLAEPWLADQPTILH